MRRLHFLTLSFFCWITFIHSAQASQLGRFGLDPINHIKTGQSYLQVNHYYLEADIDYNIKLSSQTLKGSFKSFLKQVELEAGYGLSRKFGLGFSLSWTKSSSEFREELYRLSDPELFVRGNTQLSQKYRLSYQGTLVFSPEDSKDDNSFSGGNSAEVRIELNRKVKSRLSIYGSVAFEYLAEKKRESEGGVETRATGSHIAQWLMGLRGQSEGHEFWAGVGGLKGLKGSSEQTSPSSTPPAESSSPEINYGLASLGARLRLGPSFQLETSGKFMSRIFTQSEITGNYLFLRGGLRLSF